MQSDILTIEYFQILNFDTRSDVRDFQCFNYDPLFLPEAIMVSYCISVHYFYVYNFAASLVRLMQNCFPTELRVGLHFFQFRNAIKINVFNPIG